MVSKRNAGIAAAMLIVGSGAPGFAQDAEPVPASRPSGPVQQKLVPGMAAYTDSILFGDVWTRPELSPRDRSLITVSVLIATGKTAQLEGHLGRALSNGLTPIEASGILTHLAVYCGWPSAVSALEVFDKVYTARNVDMASLQTSLMRLVPDASETERRELLQQQFGRFAPKFTELTNEIVFGDLWQRSDLNNRDRSLVTIAALSATGDDDLLEPYLIRGIENGLTPAQLAETFTHLAFYAGWAKATKAMTVAERSLR